MSESFQLGAQAAAAWPDVVGLIPAAGSALRLQPFPCSKELFPVGFVAEAAGGPPRPKVVMQYLLEKFRAAGISRTVIVIRAGKWDIPNYFQDGRHVGMAAAYVVIPGSLGPPDTLDRAYPYTAPYRVAFGFPDILFTPDDAYAQLLHKQEATGAEIVLGLHPIEARHQWDMVETDADGRVLAIQMKPTTTSLTLGWHCAVWTPAFTAFLHHWLRSDELRTQLSHVVTTGRDPGCDLAMGVLLQAALRAGLVVQSVAFAGEQPLDIGTPENLAKAVRLFAPGA